MSTASWCAPPRSRSCRSWRTIATVPVINGLTDRTHPCQLMADVMTFEEHRGPDRRQARGVVRRRQQHGDVLDPGGGESSVSSSISPVRISLRPPPEVLAGADQCAGPASRWLRTVSPRPCGAPIAWSPTPGSPWVTRMPRTATTCCARFQVDDRLMAGAKPNAIFMHCLPAHRGEEVTAERDRWAAIGGLGRGGEPPACAAGHLPAWCAGRAI